MVGGMGAVWAAEFSDDAISDCLGMKHVCPSSQKPEGWVIAG